MTEHQDTVKHVADVGMTAGAFLAWASQEAQLVTPIVTMLIALLALGWWIIRYWNWHRTGKQGGE